MEPEELSFKVVVGAAGPCGSRRRALIFFGLAAAVLGLATLGTQSSSAQTPGPEFKPLLKKLVRAPCHMDVCGWFSIETATPVGASPKGQLYVLASRSWESEHKGGKYDRPAPRTGGNVGIDFVFCSKQKPAWIHYDDEYRGGWVATPLQPGNSKVMAGVFESTYAVYWAACHNAVVRDVYDEGERLGRKLGYRFSGDDLEDEQLLGSPFDVLKW